MFISQKKNQMFVNKANMSLKHIILEKYLFFEKISQLIFLLKVYFSSKYIRTQKCYLCH